MIQGSRFNLANGLLETVNGKFRGSINGSTFRSNLDENDPNEAYMLLSSGFLNFYADGGSLFLRTSHSGIEGFGQYSGGGRNLFINPSRSEIEIASLYSDYINSLVIYENGTSLANKYASKSLSTLNVAASLTADGNIDFPGTENAAAVNWVQANYYTRSSSDSRFAPYSHSHSYATSSDLSSLENSIKSWVTANFEPKA